MGNYPCNSVSIRDKKSRSYEPEGFADPIALGSAGALGKREADAHLARASHAFAVLDTR